MSINLPKGSFVVVADGTRAILFETTGGGGDVKLRQTGEVLPRDLDDDGPAGKRPPESSQQETDEATFAKQLAHYIYKRWHADRFDHIALVADPQTLGQMRPSLHQEVLSRVVMELGKTLTNSPVADIERSIEAAL